MKPLLELADISGSYWSCTRCQRDFPVSDSHAVLFDSAGRELRFVVCPDCAGRYRIPRSVALDLESLPLPDRAARDVKTVTAHARFVSNVRTRQPDRVLRLRDADIRGLAAASHETPAGLVERLHSRGMLASD